MKSSGSTERDQDEGQGQGPASSRAENSNASVEDVEESFDKLFAAINGIVIPAPVEKKMREEFEGTKEKPTPVKNEEIRHTTSQTGSHVPVSLTDVTEELGEEVEAPLQDEKAELKLLQFPKPVSGKRSDTSFNKTSTTTSASSTLPQY